MMRNYTKYVFDEEKNIVQVIQDDKNIKKIERNDLSTIKTTLNEELYKSYRDVVVNLHTLQDLYNYNSDSQNSFRMVEGKVYALVFKYTVNQLTSSAIALDLTVNVKQSGIYIYKQTMFVSPLESKYATIYFVSQNSNDVYFDLSLKGSDVSVSLEDVKLYQCKTSKTKVCINKPIPTNYVKTIGGNTWYELDENYKNVYYGTNQTKLEGKMYLEDLLENQKNLMISSMNQYFWFDKKRGLVVTPQVSLQIGTKIYDLKDFKTGVISENDKLISLNYNAYIESGSFKTEYEVYKLNSLENNLEYVNKRNYDSSFLLKKTEDYNGIITTYSYDSYGHLLQEEVSNGNVNFKMLKTYTYTDHYLTQETMMMNGVNKSILYRYDLNNGNLIETTYPNGQVVKNKFDSTSRKLVEVSSEISTDNINLNKIGYEDDLVTSLKSAEKGYEFTYGKYNEVEKVHQGDLLIGEINTLFDNYEVVKTYDLKRTPNTFVKHHYDKYGNVFLIEKSANDSTYEPLKKMFYSDKDVDKIIDNDFPNSQNLSKSSSSKLRRVIDNEVENEQLLYYDSDGKLTKLTNTSTSHLHQPSEMNYHYDSRDRVSTINQEIGNNLMTTNVEYKNSIDGDISKVSGVLQYEYTNESDSIIETTSDDMCCELKITKDSLGRISNKEYKFDTLQALNVRYDYQTQSNVTNSLITKEQHSGLSSRYFNYTYDDMGRIKSVSNGSYAVSYQYDIFGRLVRENNPKFNKTILYRYDNNGNITSRQEGVYTLSTPTINKTNIFEYSSSIPDLLVDYDGIPVNNLNGLIAEYDGTEYEWIRGGLLSKLSYSSSQYVNYDYNADGIRTEKKYTLNGVETTHLYTLEGNKILFEKIISDAKTSELHYMYLGDELVGFVHDGDKYYYEKNFRKDIIGLYNSSGDLIATYEYDAWGNHKVYTANGTESTNAGFIGNINPFRYRGYYYDVETGLFWLSSRYYSPELCRFISPDDVSYLDPSSINGLNLYAYCANNPVMYVDPSGHEWYNPLIELGSR